MTYTSRSFARLCRRLNLKHIRTPPLLAANQRQGRAPLNNLVGLHTW